MIKKLCTILMLGLLAVPVMAQQETCNKKCNAVSYGPKKGQWQVNLVMGNSGASYNESYAYSLIPQYTNTTGSIGLPNGSGDYSGNLNGYLNIKGLNDHSLLDLGAVQFKYFVSDCWDVNVTMGMNLSATPKKDFVEAEDEIPDMVIPSQKYINAQVNNSWFVNVGTDRYFAIPSNARIQPYIGGVAGFQMAHVSVAEPYTGVMVPDACEPGEVIEQQVLLANGKIGQMLGVKVAGVCGVEYALSQGLLLGVEFQPLSYRYDVIQISPRGFDTYNATHHNFKVFDTPCVKLGFRF